MKRFALDFESEIAKAMEMVLAASHRAAQAALDDAFSQSSTNHPATKQAVRKRFPDPAKENQRRRSPESIESMANELLQEIWATPGATLAVLSAKLGTQPYEMKVPIRRLKGQGKVRTVGVNQSTRYFPVDKPSDSQHQSRQAISLT